MADQQLLCPNCISTIRPSKIPPMGTLVRCPKCSETFLIDPTVIIGPGSGPAFGSVPPVKAPKAAPTANPSAPSVWPVQATPQSAARPASPMPRPMPAAPQAAPPNAYTTQPNAFAAQPSVLQPIASANPPAKAKGIDTSSSIAIPGWIWGMAGAAVAVVLMLVGWMVLSSGGKDDRQLAAGKNAQAAGNQSDANAGAHAKPGGDANADPPGQQAQPDAASKPADAGKKNSAGPAAEVQLIYNFKPDLNYMYEFELESGHDENGPLRSKGSIVYTALPRMQQRQAILSANKPKQKGTASAFVIGKDGTLVTCAHVVSDATKVEVLLNNQNYQAKVLHVDTENDLAVIQIDAKNLQVLPLAASEPVVGDDIFAAGYPLSDFLGDTLKVTRGSVAGFVDHDGKRLLQIDATINQGNSGCPVLTSTGSVVGVVSSVIRDSLIEGVNFARDLPDLKSFLKQHNVSFTEKSNGQTLRGNELAAIAGPAIGRVLVEIEEPKPKEVMRVRFNGSTRSGKEQTLKSTSGTVAFAPDGEVMAVEGDSDYMLVSTSTGRLIFDALPPAGKHRWKSEREHNVVEYEQSQQPNGIFPPGIGGPLGRAGFPPRGMPGIGLNPFAPNQPQEKVKRRLKVEERIGYELKELTADKAVVDTHVKSEWIDEATRDTALELESEGQYTFDRIRAAISAGESNGKVHLQSNGVETAFPVRLAFMLKDAVSNDEMKQRAEKARKDNEERTAQINADRKAKFLADLPAAIEALKDPAANKQKSQEALREITPVGWKPDDLPRRDEVAALLNRYLKSTDRWTLHQAVDAAALWATQVNAEALLTLVSQTDFFIRRGAIKALGQLEPSEQIAKAVAQTLDTDSRNEATEVLIKMKKFAEAPTIPFLKSSDWVTRHAALKVLTEVGGKDSLAPIEAIANGSDQIDVHVAKEALTSIRTRIAAGKN